MLFSSLTFLFVFLPALLAVYFITPKRFRNGVLLFFSLIFFAWGGVSYSLLLILSILVNYLCVVQIRKATLHKKKWLIGGLIFNIGLIVVFKYLNFFLSNVNGIGELLSDNFEAFPPLKIIMPLGISFFTFQQMSFLWDVYRNPPERKIKLIESALYISLFPQLIAGPIVRYKDIIHDIRNRVESLSLFESGIKRFCIGLFKKIVFANTCAVIADEIMLSEATELSSASAWLGLIAYSLQIYYDFSGYSDMAIGLGRMFGFRIGENFNFPYISKSIKEFWRRWHISLSTWFRDYVYIPLGGNRRSNSRTYLNLFIVFLLTGFWHGATWSFIFWGLFHGAFLILERSGLDRLLDKLPKIVSWSYTMFVVMIAWVFFKIETFSEASEYVGKLFYSNPIRANYFYAYLDAEKILILVLAILFSAPIVRVFKLIRFIEYNKHSFGVRVMTTVFILALFLLSVMYINSGSYNPFIYSRF
jgi:alginate O-acetyltransferase complex protein AlgI